MPKVSPQHLAQRRQQIVDAAIGLFAERGFHDTSMQQIIAASGMSAGALYHYFPSKRDLVRAVAEVMAVAYLEPLRTLPSRRQLPAPADVVDLFCTHLARLHAQRPDLTRLGVFLWGEELRDPELARAVDAKREIIGGLVPLVEQWRLAGVVRPDCDPAAVAQVLFGLLPGFMLQLNTVGVVPAREYAAGVVALATSGPAPAPRALERTGHGLLPAQHRWRPISPEAGDAPEPEPATS